MLRHRRLKGFLVLTILSRTLLLRVAEKVSGVGTRQTSHFGAARLAYLQKYEDFGIFTNKKRQMCLLDYQDVT